MDARLRDLERKASLGDTDAKAKLTAARNRSLGKVPKFLFRTMGIEVNGTKVSHPEFPEWCKSHKHNGRDAAKKCAIRLGKFLMRNSLVELE